MKKAILTFDDGYFEDYERAFLILKKRGLVGTSYIATADIGKAGYLSWDNIREMAKSGWDFQCHTHNHPKLTELSAEEIEREFRMVDNEFLRHSIPAPEHHAYPYGSNDEAVRQITKKYRRSGRGISGARGGGDYEIKSYGMNRKDIHSIINNSDTIFIHTHDIGNEHRGYGIKIKKFVNLIDFLINNGFKIMPVKKYYENT